MDAIACVARLAIKEKEIDSKKPQNIGITSI